MQKDGKGLIIPHETPSSPWIRHCSFESFYTAEIKFLEKLLCSPSFTLFISKSEKYPSQNAYSAAISWQSFRIKEMFDYENFFFLFLLFIPRISLLICELWMCVFEICMSSVAIPFHYTRDEISLDLELILILG